MVRRRPSDVTQPGGNRADGGLCFATPSSSSRRSPWFLPRSVPSAVGGRRTSSIAGRACWTLRPRAVTCVILRCEAFRPAEISRRWDPRVSTSCQGLPGRYRAREGAVHDARGDARTSAWRTTGVSSEPPHIPELRGITVALTGSARTGWVREAASPTPRARRGESFKTFDLWRGRTDKRARRCAGRWIDRRVRDEVRA